MIEELQVKGIKMRNYRIVTHFYEDEKKREYFTDSPLETEELAFKELVKYLKGLVDQAKSFKVNERCYRY